MAGKHFPKMRTSKLLELDFNTTDMFCTCGQAKHLEKKRRSQMVRASLHAFRKETRRPEAELGHLKKRQWNHARKGIWAEGAPEAIDREEGALPQSFQKDTPWHYCRGSDFGYLVSRILRALFCGSFCICM